MHSRNLIQILPLLTAALFTNSSLEAQAVSRIRVNPSEVEIQVGATKNVTAQANAANGNAIVNADITWTSNNTGIVSVEQNSRSAMLAKLVGIGAGNTTIIVRAGGIREQVNVTVVGADEFSPQGSGPAFQLQAEPNPLRLFLAEDVKIKTTFVRQDGEVAARQGLSWEALGNAVAIDNGQVTGISLGSGVIRVTSDGGLQTTIPVTVSAAEFQFNKNALSMSPGSLDSLSIVVPTQGNRALGTTSLRQIVWRSSNPSVATVTPTGLVRAISHGNARVSANGYGYGHTIPVSIHKQVEFMDNAPVTSRPVFVPLGGSVVFDVRSFDADDNLIPEALVDWAPRSGAVYEFDEANKTVSGTGLGVDTLIARSAGGGLPDIVWVIQVVAGGLKLSADRVGLMIGEGVSVTANLTDDAGNTVSEAAEVMWSSSNPAVADVNEAGLIIARASGTAEIVGNTPWGRADTVKAFVQSEILVSSNRSGGGAIEIFAFDRNSSGNFQQVTHDSSLALMPSYSPDGTRIAYVSTVSGNNDIWIANADGSDARKVTEFSGDDIMPDWTADGTRIVYESRSSGNSQIWIMNSDGTDKRQLTDDSRGPNTQPAVDPQGTGIVFVSLRDRNYEIYLMDMDGSNQRNVTSSAEREQLPRWFPDGSFAYLQNNQIVRFQGGARSTLSSSGTQVTSFAISSDGDLIAMIVTTFVGSGTKTNLFLQETSGPAGPREVMARPTEQFNSVAFRK